MERGSPALVHRPSGRRLAAMRRGGPARCSGTATCVLRLVVLPGGNLAMGRYDVTVGEYRAFASATGGGAGGGCRSFGDDDSWRDPGFPQTANKELSKAAKAAGQDPFTTYQIRHSFAAGAASDRDRRRRHPGPLRSHEPRDHENLRASGHEEAPGGYRATKSRR